MRVTHYGVILLIAGASFIACEGSQGPSGQSQAPGTAAMGALAVAAPSAMQSKSAGPNIRQVTMMDACDGPTFNQAIGPGTCIRNAGVAFSEFVALLTAHQSVGAWHNSPPQTDAALGDALVAVNNGGEVHTFTRVAEYGGGIIPFLNDLSGTPTVAPECSAETTFVPPGGSDSEALDRTGELKFQCCIHPWMRTTVLVKSH
jgi:hypothetical protein